MKDRYGYTFHERCDQQLQQLLAWRPLLQAEVYESTLAVLSAMNTPAADETKTHQVALGGALAQVIYAYPRHVEILDVALMGGDTFPLINPRP